jgi:hypothetical protein
LPLALVEKLTSALLPPAVLVTISTTKFADAPAASDAGRPLTTSNPLPTLTEPSVSVPPPLFVTVYVRCGDAAPCATLPNVVPSPSDGVASPSPIVVPPNFTTASGGWSVTTVAL